jgi:hypothetical protein
VADSHRRKAAKPEPNADEIRVRFSPAMKEIFGELDAAVNGSPHFDAEIRSIVHDWATDAAPPLSTVLTSLPIIAQETFQHIQKSGDQNAAHAWEELSTQMLQEHAFTLVGKQRGR